MSDPCRSCGGFVVRVTGRCVECEQLHRRAQPGPQTKFIISPATLRIFIGAMGSGKTYALLLDALIKVGMVPGANGLICRRHAKDLDVGGGIWDEAKVVFEGSGAVFRGGRHMDVRWPATGAKLSFRHLEDRSVERFKGPGFSWVGIEEASEVEDMGTIMWLMQRMRSSSGIKTTMALTTNPAPTHALRQWVDAYLEQRDDDRGIPDRSKSGLIRYTLKHTTTGKQVFADTPEEAGELAEGDPDNAMTYAVISSWLSDNAILTEADPDYAKKFAQMSPTERALNYDADWNAAPELGGMLRRSRWNPVAEPIAPFCRAARGWDKAATLPSEVTPNPDYTAGPLWRWDTLGNAYLCGLAACRDEPPEVAKLQRNTATLDGPGVDQVYFIDPAAAGKFDALGTKRNFEASARCGRTKAYPAGNKKGQKVLNATPLSKALEQGRVYILAGDWLNEPYHDAGDAPRTIGELLWSQVGVFVDETGRAKDDIVDGMSVGFNHGDRGATAVTSTATVKQTATAASKLLQQRLRSRQGGGYRG